MSILTARWEKVKRVVKFGPLDIDVKEDIYFTPWYADIGSFRLAPIDLFVSLPGKSSPTPLGVKGPAGEN